MLKSIVIVTLLVTSVTRSEQAYEQAFDYATKDEGRVPAELAALWDAPMAEGRPYVLMQPESGAPVFLRFIEAADAGNYAPMKTLGWNAVELQVQDPDVLVADLDPARFELIGPPAFLTDKQNVRAAQVLGPDRELLYLTSVLDPSLTTFRIGQAQTRVDRVFIMVLGTADLDATTAFYRDVLGQPLSGPWPYRVEILSRAWGRPLETEYDLAIAQLEESFLVEVDGYPVDAPRRDRTSAGLPFGPAVVSFRVERLDGTQPHDGRIRRLEIAPYDGRRVRYLRGPSGEGIELVEFGSP